MKTYLCFTLTWLMIVAQMPLQEEVQPNSNDILEAIINLGNRLDSKIANFEAKMAELQNKMSDLEGNMSDLIDDKISSLLAEFQVIKNPSGVLAPSLGDPIPTPTLLAPVTTNPETLNTSSTCPVSDGYFVAPGTGQCLRIFNDQFRTWDEAECMCKLHGLTLAKPQDPIALRKYIVENHYTELSALYIDIESLWLGGRGDGSILRWVRDQSPVNITSGLWLQVSRGQPRFMGRITRNTCMRLFTRKDGLKYNPEEPYHTSECDRRRLTLCELAAPICDAYGEDPSKWKTS